MVIWVIPKAFKISNQVNHDAKLESSSVNVVQSKKWTKQKDKRTTSNNIW